MSEELKELRELDEAKRYIMELENKINELIDNNVKY